ncbi:MAG: hypothetical protein WC440_07300, partial [Candidatus Omnitrophota bacterium]
MRLNGKIRDVDFQLHQADITDRPLMKERVKLVRKSSGGSSIEITVISNIGVWDIYNATNASSIDLIRHLPEATHFIGSGYTRTSSLNDKQTKHDKAFIRRLGFSIDPEQVKVDCTELIAAWSARRASSPVVRCSEPIRKTLHRISRDGRRTRYLRWGLTGNRSHILLIGTTMFLFGIMALALVQAFFSGVPLLLIFMLPIQLTIAFIDTVIIQPIKLFIGFLDSPLSWAYSGIFIAIISVLLIRHIHGFRSLISGVAGWLADLVLLFWPRHIFHNYWVWMRKAVLVTAIFSCSFIVITAGADTVKDICLEYFNKYTGMSVFTGDRHMISLGVSNTRREAGPFGRESVDHYLDIDWQWDSNNYSLFGDFVIKGKSVRRSLESGLLQPRDTGFESQEHIVMPERIGSRYPFGYGRVGQNNKRSDEVIHSGELERFTVKYLFPKPGDGTRSWEADIIDRQEVERKGSYEIKDIAPGGSSSPVIQSHAARFNPDSVSRLALPAWQVGANVATRGDAPMRLK